MEQNNINYMPLIGDYAPGFQGVTTQGEVDFPQDYKGKWVVLFSHPGDFLPVSTTEYMIVVSMLHEFKYWNTELIGLSVDSIHSHIAWIRKIRELSWKDIKHADVSFPVIEDVRMEIARKYGMIHPGNSNIQTVRGVFIIDPESIIRSILYYPSTVGRNMDEILRLVIALQKVDKEKVALPANWKPGDDVILSVPGTCGLAKERLERVNEKMYCLDWFLCFQQTTEESVYHGYEPEFNSFPSGLVSCQTEMNKDKGSTRDK